MVFLPDVWKKDVAYLVSLVKVDEQRTVSDRNISHLLAEEVIGRDDVQRWHFPLEYIKVVNVRRNHEPAVLYRKTCYQGVVL